MKVKMLATAAGPNGVRLAGLEYEVDDEFGERLVKCGAALRVDKPAPVRMDEAAAEPVAVETATVTPVETAAAGPQEKKARRKG